MYDGQYIANSSSTVVVTVNYRLGAIGFLAFGEGNNAPQGNYGLKVCVLAVVLYCTCVHTGPKVGFRMD